MYQEGQRIKIVKGPWAGDCGVIRQVTKRVLKIEVDGGALGLAMVNPAHVEPIEQAPLDFDGGFGIGGLGRHDEPGRIPTIAQIERMERIEREMIVCRRCGASDIIDGAMFTTGGGNICDDCF